MKNLVFSFCIYGNKKKYCFGLYENLQIINKHYPKAFIFIYVCGDNVPQIYLELYQTQKNVRLFYNKSQENMVDRFFALDDDTNMDIMIVRDCDSRIHSRDRWCINHFIKSNYICHTIRDHGAHRHPIMGGLWGLKKQYIEYLKFSIRDLHLLYQTTHKTNYENCQYHYDMNFLRDMIYIPILSQFIAYIQYEHLRIDEYCLIIPFPVKDGDFCGQVIDFDENDQSFKQF